MAEIEKLSAKSFQKSLEKGELPDKKEYQKQLNDLILDGLLIINGYGRLGVQDIIKSDAKAMGEDIEFAEVEVNFENEILSPKDAIITLESMLGVQSGSIYETMLKSGNIDQLVSLISGSSYDDFVKYINAKAGETLKSGGSYADWYNGLVGSDKIDSFIKPGYWQAVWNTNYTSLYNIGIQQESERLKEFIAMQEYMSVLDNSTTELCTALDNQKRTATDWNKSGLIPPNHFNCRSFLATVSIYRADSQRLNVTPNNYFADLKQREIKPDKGFDKPLSIKNIIKSIA